jgi:hypothetical protein
VKNRVIAIWFFTIFFLVACQLLKPAPIASTQYPLPTGTHPFTSTPHFTLFTLAPPPSATYRIPVTTPEITATPIFAKVSTDKDLEFIIEKQIYPYPCFGYNFTKSPLTDINHASKLNFIEVDFQPDSKKYIVEEIANNANGNRKAWVACDNADNCKDKIYVQDNKSKKVYEIDWEDSMPWRPIQWITWINSDILTFLQSANPDQALVMAINFDERKVLYEAIIFPDYACITPTPTP